MIKFENTEVMGWEAAIRGMRNPMNSWEKSDSGFCIGDRCYYTQCWNPIYQNNVDDCPLRHYEEDGNPKIMKIEGKYGAYILGPNDLDLMKRLRNAGTDHRKFMRMITVYVDITAPLYWWKEMDTYQVGVVKNSCSTMHKIQAKEFTLEDFSYEHLFNEDNSEEDQEHYNLWLDHMRLTVIMLNRARERYLKTKDKKYWWQMIQLLPSSYNQKRTVMLNYEVLANIYKSRKNHKLDEWSEHKTKLPLELVKACNDTLIDVGEGGNKMFGFCDWIKTLPYSELITGPSLKDIPICHEIMEEAKRRVAEDIKKEGYGMLEELIKNELMAKGFEVSFSENYGLSDSITIMISKNNKKVKQVVDTFEMENSNVSEDVYIFNVIKYMINMWNEEFEE